MSMTGAVPPSTERETRQRQLLGLGRLILQQARAGQWDAVRLADHRLAQLIDHLRQQPALWQSLVPARDQVRHWHQEALALCQQETAQRKQEWDALSLKREGLQAYDEAQAWA
ncbi:LafX [Aeromonas rivipollensis]|uniref:LafX n=1 Tax=Aeromonas rivipollensis TaxID=948519 RepID=UPI00259F63BF|nr:LafX [Aeromonas rivipollensis]MDM5085950.1 LafX [Aeromonas rivipollensis]MDM5098256.1 LafX [Aeromonas rivipollensis]MDM5106614.1 LafX [Aeromonas rivipollensis]